MNYRPICWFSRAKLITFPLTTKFFNKFLSNYINFPPFCTKLIEFSGQICHFNANFPQLELIEMMKDEKTSCINHVLITSGYKNVGK